MVLAPALLSEPAPARALADGWALLLYLGLGPTAAAYALFTAGLGRVPATLAGIVTLPHRRSDEERREAEPRPLKVVFNQFDGDPLAIKLFGRLTGDIGACKDIENDISGIGTQSNEKLGQSPGKARGMHQLHPEGCLFSGVRPLWQATLTRPAAV